MATSAEPLRICLASAEVAPFAKTGGLGDVTAALTRYLALAGHEVRTFLPRYGGLDTDGQTLVPVQFLTNVPLTMGGRVYRYSVHTTTLPATPVAAYFIDCPELFGGEGIYGDGPREALRFAFLARATIECCQRMGWQPNVFHINDWHTALLPLYLRTAYAWDRLFATTKTLLTIHNVGYQGIFGTDVLPAIGLAGEGSRLYQEDLAAGRMNFLKTGILYAGLITTVSRTHAREIQSERYGMGLAALLRARADHLVGIVNGIDYDEWDPARDPLIPHTFSAEDLAGKAANKRHLVEGFGLALPEEAPLVGMVSRLVHQKGAELVAEAVPRLLEREPFGVVILGSGERRYEELLARLAAAFPGRVGFYRGYNNELAHLIEAGADLFLMPSRYEPCGLNQMYSQRYGTLPVVRSTGGLADTVEPFEPTAGTGTGFVFEHYTAQGLAWALGIALETYRDRDAWTAMVKRAMARDFSWTSQVEKYVTLYRGLAEGRI